ncbi:alpha/beta fold hydrolase [Cohnella nanjingensis]|uniref:Alpha/beta fold hydrolase n=1 Tax=Cohnella nanjingensis TaxID=1387779 RepID=A0A7X0RV25_9BACL|nr:alpha/beta fold hydrolase [Cohnella nanjingensis]MBB6674120.1 alpha/beta fold hydrolase [Cohnella nanjingensis]
MPLVDMPLEELQAYEGRSPKPADFDAYWERALDEMRAVDPQLTIEPSSFQVPYAECYDLYFTGVRGARVYAKYVKPKLPAGAGKHPALLQFHGYSGHSGDWTSKLAYAALGFTVLAMDCRGQGGLSEDTGGVKGNTLHGHIIRGADDHEDQLLFRHIFLDAAQLAGIAMNLPEVDPARVAATGASQGGGLTLACAALEPRVARLAPIYPFLSDYRRVYEMDLAKNAYEEIRDYFRRFDPTHRREDAFFERLGYIDVQYLAPRIRGEVLMAVGLMDTITPPSTQFAAYNKIVADKRMVVYPDFGHEGLPGFDDRSMAFFQAMR